MVCSPAKINPEQTSGRIQSEFNKHVHGRYMSWYTYTPCTSSHFSSHFFREGADCILVTCQYLLLRPPKIKAILSRVPVLPRAVRFPIGLHRLPGRPPFPPHGVITYFVLFSVVLHPFRNGKTYISEARVLQTFRSILNSQNHTTVSGPRPLLHKTSSVSLFVFIETSFVFSKSH